MKTLYTTFMKSKVQDSKKQQANFFLSVHLMQMLKKNVPPRQQSMFVEKALLSALKKESFMKVLNSSDVHWKTEDHSDSTGDFLRSLRESKRI